MVYPIAKRTLFQLIKLFLREIKGIENIPKKGSFIITSNHESFLDPFFIGSILIPLLDKKIHFLAVKGRFWDLLGDRIARDWAGCILLEGRGEEAIDEAISLLNKNEIVGIFIEGKTSLDGKLLRKLTNDVMHAISELTGKPYNY